MTGQDAVKPTRYWETQSEWGAAAVPLARQTLEQHGITDRSNVVLGDARRLPLEAGSVDVVAMLDVVEHLAAQELALSRKIGLEPKIVRRELRAMKREEAAKAKRGAA